jgi:hypothetical protein
MTFTTSKYEGQQVSKFETKNLEGSVGVYCETKHQILLQLTVPYPFLVEYSRASGDLIADIHIFNKFPNKQNVRYTIR